MQKLAEYGFPVDYLDFQMLVKCFLDKLGRTERRFTNNKPGKDFVRAFLNRHKTLSVRFSTNVKRARMALDEKVLSDYIDHLQLELDSIPPSEIWNYNETNLTNDPGRKRVICRRGTKYVDRFCNHSKTVTSVMFCENADGTKFLPPYVVYKSDCLWEIWQEGGPRGTRYNRTRSGWFDAFCFEDWFEFHFLPAIRHAVGPVAIIGDNPASHINARVLQLCSDHHMKFICLPPNATHICQPLDVAVYRPLKGYWRRVLTE